MAVELLTVIYYKFYNPNASRDLLRNIRFFYCDVDETLYNKKGVIKRLNLNKGSAVYEIFF